MVRGIALSLLLLAGCSLGRPPGPGGELLLRNGEIHRDTTWRGRVVIDGTVKVFKGATLTILPGSEIAFIPRDVDRDGLGDGTLLVEGSLVAIGRPDAPIVFRSASPTPHPGDWLELRVDFSREARLQYCEIRDSAHALHAHFTRAVIEDSHIHHNLDGSRLGQGSFVLRHNLIEANEGKGINFRNASVEIVGNVIRRNGAGIFLFETDRTLTIAGNDLYDNGSNLQLGDFFHSDVVVGANWWGSADPQAVKMSIHDRDSDATLGQVTVEVAPAWIEDAGPRRPATLAVVGQLATDGFVDAAPQALGNDLLVASWDGHIYRSDGVEGWRWVQTVGETVDSAPVWDGRAIYGQTWGRRVFALAADDGRPLWSFAYPGSTFDDHRQGGVARVNELLLVPGWNGTLYALDARSGALRWEYATPGPLRATPLVAGERIFLPGGDGALRAFALDGKLLWERPASAALLAPAALTQNGIVSLARDGTVTAYDRDGEQLWQQRLGEDCFYAGPTLADGAVLVATTAGSLWKLALADGRVLWRKTGLGPVYATPLVLDSLLLVGDNAGVLTLIDPLNGNTLDQLEFGAPLQGGPSRVGNELAVGGRDQRVYRVKVTARPAGEPH